MNRASRDLSYWIKLYYDLATEVDQVLGKALGYPWYKDDQKNFPGTTGEDGVCTGEHVPESLLAEAAKGLKKITDVTLENKRLHSENSTYVRALSNSIYVPKGTWEWPNPPALFGGSDGIKSTWSLHQPVCPVCPVCGDVPKPKDGENLQQKVDRLKAYLLKRARENNKRAEELENKQHSFHRLDELAQDEHSSYYHSGKGAAYANAHKKVLEILG